MRRRTLLIAGVPALSTVSTPGHVQERYPDRPIRLVVGFPPGGSNDIVARIVAGPLGETLGTQVIVDNRAGASGTIAGTQVAHAPADGYTLMLSSASPLVIAPHALQKRPFDVERDFIAINSIGLTPEAIAVGPQTPARNFTELMALARTREVTIASSGNGGLPHLTIELLKRASKGRIVHVPYRGAAPAITDVLAGHVNAVTMDLPALIGFIRDGRLKALAVTSERRVDFLPEVPTADEQGLPSFLAVNWLGIFTPASTAQPIVDRLFTAIGKVVADPQVRAQLATAAVVPNAAASTRAFQAFIAAENERWGRLAREAGAKLEE